MKKLLFLYLLLNLIGRCSLAQVPIWENLSPQNQVFLILQKTLDGALVTSGNKPLGGGRYQMHLAKYTIQGTQLWHKPGRVMVTGEEDLLQTPDGRYLFTACMRRTTTANVVDAYLQQFDAQGDTTSTWAVNYVEPGNQASTEMLRLENGDLLIAGMQQPPRFFLRRTDSLGNTLWYRKYGYSDNTYGTRLIRNRRNNLVMLGLKADFPVPFHPFLLEVDLNGNAIDSALIVLTDTMVQESTNRIFNNLIQTSDGGYAFGGDMPTKGYMAKTDSAFNLLWRYDVLPILPIGGSAPVVTSKIIELQDSTLLFMWKENHPQAGVFYITRLTKNGQFIEQKTMQSSVCPNGVMLPYDWQFLADSSIVFCGWCVSNQQAYIGRWGNLNFPLPMVTTYPPLPIVAYAGSNDSVCANAAPFTLSGFSPSGGTWSGTGVSAAGVFTPGASLAGTHTLTYTVTSGSQTATATKTVTVHALPVAEFTHTLSGNQVVFSNASAGAATYSWSFGDGNTSTEPNPSHTYSGSGSYTVTLTAITAEGCTATTTQTILLTATANLLEQAIKLYPNPTQGILVIERTDEGSGPILVEVYSTQGQLVKRALLSARQAQVDLGNLAGGVYQVKLLTGQAVVHRQVVLMR